MIQFYRELAKILSTLLAPHGISEEQVFQLLERPQNSDHGDIAFPCFQVAKVTKAAPPKIAQELAQSFNAGTHENFVSAQALGPFLNFRLSETAALSIVKHVFTEKDKFGHSQKGKGIRVLIEYSSPNVAKELHIGHFRNTILGQSLNNIYRATGHDVISINHLGDWGSQFGKVAWGYLKFGDEAEMAKNPLAYLTSIYVKATEEAEKDPAIDRECRLLFKKIEEKDPDLTALWRKFCKVSIEGLQTVYSRLGVSFDHIIGESFYFDKVNSLLEELKSKNLLELSDGAQVVNVGEDMPPCLIVTGDGTSLYATRDLEAAIWRHKNFQFQKCVYVVGSEQQLHFKQFIRVLAKLGYAWSADLFHAYYGLYRFKDGKFSTRKGRVILAEEVLDEAKIKALELINVKNPALANKDDVAEIIGIGAVIFNDLSTDRLKDVEFDWVRILDFEGDTGPYLQYSYARACSILRQGAAAGNLPIMPLHSLELAKSPAAIGLMKEFGRLETSIEGALRLHKPSIVANYALDLAKAFNGFYREVKVLDKNSTPEEIQKKLGLVFAFKQVLSNTLALICMKLPEEM